MCRTCWQHLPLACYLLLVYVETLPVGTHNLWWTTILPFMRLFQLSSANSPPRIKDFLSSHNSKIWSPSIFSSRESFIQFTYLGGHLGPVLSLIEEVATQSDWLPRVAKESETYSYRRINLAAEASSKLIGADGHPFFCLSSLISIFEKLANSQ